MNVQRPHETVLVAVDGSAASAAAVRWAAAEASRRQARLHAVHVVATGRPGAVPPGRDQKLDLDRAREAYPGRVGSWVFEHGIEVDIAVSVVTGDVAGQIARGARDAALVVMGAPRCPEHEELPDQLAQQCLCPVAIVSEIGDVTLVGDGAGHTTPQGASHARP